MWASSIWCCWRCPTTAATWKAPRCSTTASSWRCRPTTRWQLLLRDGHCLREHALSLCNLTDRRRTEAFEATSLPTLVQMVDNGLGITPLPELAVDAGLLRGTSLVTRPLASEEPGREIALVWRRGTGRREEFLLLAKELAERAKKVRREQPRRRA